MKLKIGLGIGSLASVLLTAGFLVRHHRLRNYSDLGFTRCGTTVSPDRDVGSDLLKIARDEPVQINYACEDKDKLAKILVYDNGKIILDIDTPDKKGFHASIFYRHKNLGEHVYRLVAVDSLGNKREDTARIIVEDRFWERKLILGVSIGYAFDR